MNVDISGLNGALIKASENGLLPDDKRVNNIIGLFVDRSLGLSSASVNIPYDLRVKRLKEIGRLQYQFSSYFSPQYRSLLSPDRFSGYSDDLEGFNKITAFVSNLGDESMIQLINPMAKFSTFVKDNLFLITALAGLVVIAPALIRLARS